MSDYLDRAVEAAAKPIFESCVQGHNPPYTWETGKGILLDEDQKDAWREVARDALEAAEPIIRERVQAELREALKEQEAAYRQEAHAMEDEDASSRSIAAANVLYTTQLIMFGGTPNGD